MVGSMPSEGSQPSWGGERAEDESLLQPRKSAKRARRARRRLTHEWTLAVSDAYLDPSRTTTRSRSTGCHRGHIDQFMLLGDPRSGLISSTGHVYALFTLGDGQNYNHDPGAAQAATSTANTATGAAMGRGACEFGPPHGRSRWAGRIARQVHHLLGRRHCRRRSTLSSSCTHGTDP